MRKWMVIGWLLIFNLLGPETLWSEEAKRPFYEHPGDYRQQIDQRKDDFKARFGYELLDLEMGWKPDEIEELTDNPLIFYGALSTVALEFKIPIIPTPSGCET